MIVGGVDDDAVQPGAEAGVAFEGVEVPEGLDEGFLSHIGRVPGVAERAKGQVVHPPLVPPVQLGQGLGVAARALVR